MKYADVQEYIDEIRNLNVGFDYWLDSDAFERENSERVPGAYISKYGFWVIGVTVGGNAITASDNDMKIRMCDHTGWYQDSMCCAIKKDYEKRNYSKDNIVAAQIVIADSFSDLSQMVLTNELDKMIESYE